MQKNQRSVLLDTAVIRVTLFVFGTGVDVLCCAALWRVGPTSLAFAEQQNNTHNKFSPTLIPAH